MKSLSSIGEVKTAVIYMRVSTQRQKNEGFSLQYQEKMLRDYCRLHNIKIIEVYSDSYSAKNFNDRPGYKKFLIDYKNKIVKPDLFICISVDRYSRNLNKSLSTFEEFKKMGVELKILNLDVDLDSPEGFLSFGFNAMFAEYDNRVRSEKTKKGLRQAKREGYCIGTSPKGYKRLKGGDGKTMLVKDENAVFVKEAFSLIATGEYSIDHVRVTLIKKGFKCSKSQFYNLLKVIEYTGRLRLEATRDEPEEIVNAKHEAIIDIPTFEQVQKVINNKSKRSKGNLSFPLKGFLLCPKCNSVLRASSPRGRNKHYSYYHCDSKNKCGCKHFKIEDVHKKFQNNLNSIQLPITLKEYYLLILKDVFSLDDTERKNKILRLEEESKKISQRLEKVHDSYYDGIIEHSTYNERLKSYKNTKWELEGEISNLKSIETSFDKYITFSIDLFTNISEYYNMSSYSTKRKIVGSIFSEKWVFDGKKHRTESLNSVLSTITNNINAFSEQKKGLIQSDLNQSYKAPPAGLEPATL